MLDIIITHYREPWEVCKKQFWMLDMQRRVDWSQIRVTIINDGGSRLPEEKLNELDIRWKAAEFRQIDIPHGGISAARNAGIEQTDGEWLMFCDCDDCFENIHALRSIQNALKKAEDFVMLWTQCSQEDSTIGGSSKIPEYKTFVFCHGKLYKRQFLLDEGIRFPTDLPMNEDSCFNHVIIARADNTRIGKVCSHEPIYAWIRRDGSVTTKPESVDLAAVCQVKRNMIVTKENELHRPEEYRNMVTRSAYDAFYMIHGKRLSDSCKQEILGMFTPWIRGRKDAFGSGKETLSEIRAVSRIELLDQGEEIEDSHEAVRAWVMAL